MEKINLKEDKISKVNRENCIKKKIEKNEIMSEKKEIICRSRKQMMHIYHLTYYYFYLA